MIIRLLAIICILGFSILPANAFWFGGGGSGVPGGTNEQVQYRNEAGTFSGHVGLVYNAATAKLTVGYLSAGGGYNNLINAGGGTWTKTRQLTVTAPAQILPAGYSVRVALAGAAAASVFNSGTVDALRIATSVATVATTITAAITSTQTTIAVASIAGLTTVGIIKIENEYIGYNGWTGLVLNNCVRGSMGSIPATHANAAAVTSIQELERYVSAYTADSVVVWFKLRSQIAAAGTDTTYTLYYENDLAGVSPATLDNIFTKKLETDATLLAEYHLDEGTLSTSADSSGNGKNLTLFNAPTWQTTDGGQWDGVNKQFNKGSYLSFDGTDDYCESVSNIGVTGGNSFTMEFWVKNITLVDYDNYVSIGNATAFALMGIGQSSVHTSIFLNCWDSGSNLTISGIPDLSANWVFLTYVKNGTNEKVYANAALKNERTLSLNITDAPIRIGGKPGGYAGCYSNANIDGVRVYNRALSLNEINAHYKRRMWVADDTVALDGNFAAGGNEVVSGDYVGGTKCLGLTTYADNAAALEGGLSAGDMYRTATGVSMIVY